MIPFSGVTQGESLGPGSGKPIRIQDGVSSKPIKKPIKDAFHQAPKRKIKSPNRRIKQPPWRQLHTSHRLRHQ